MSKTLAAQIAEEFLRWPDRLNAIGQRFAAAGKSDEQQQSLLASHLASRLPSRHDDDIRNGVERFRMTYATFPDWWSALLTEHRIRIEFFAGEPRVEQEGFSHWWLLTKEFDPDALILLELARRNPAVNAEDHLDAWGTFAVSADADLGRLLSRRSTGGPRLSDTHVHLAGCDSIPHLWASIAVGRQRLLGCERYAHAEHTRSERDSSNAVELRLELRILEEGLAARRKLLEALGFARPRLEDVHARFADTDLRSERKLLAAAWRQSLGGDGVVLSHLDRYLVAKNLFLRHHHQYPGGNPGLRRFRRYFDNAKDKIFTESRELRANQIYRRVRFAAEPPDLTHLELRIAPFDSIGEYVQFFNAWKTAETIVQRRLQRPLHVRFVIHFLRPLSREQLAESIPFERLRAKIDRQSAVLHLLRRRAGPWAQYVVGLDVANLERDCPPDIFTPYLRLLRGEPQELARLSRQPGPCAGAWTRLQAQRMAEHPVELPKLGLTFHVGEDFYHPLEGMRSMDAAVVGGAMVSGDRIGHGLAAGWDLARSYRDREGGIEMPQGVLLDDLVWFRRRLLALPHAVGAPVLPHQLQDRITELSRAVYNDFVPVEIMDRVADHRHHLVPANDGGRDDPLDLTLRARELYDRDCRRRRSELVLLPVQFFRDHLDALRAVQAAFIEDLSRRRLVVEFNPASNWSVAALRDLTDHPIHHYLHVAGDSARMSLNTDDPGVFGTRLENEYALVLEALLTHARANGQAPQTCFAALERMRVTGSESVFG